jgi:N-acetylglucosamine-6-phosphate deacetylase
MIGHRGTVLAASRIVTGTVVHSPGWLTIDNDRIVAVGAGRPAQVDRDLGAAIVVPGFIDLHVHGGGGGVFTDGTRQSALQAVYTHRRHGTTTTMASLVTAGPADLLTSVRQLAELYQDGVIAGIHLEGPWISPRRCGAHDPAQLRDPDPDELGRLLTAGQGAIAVVTIAPELPGGEDAIRQVVDAGAVAAVGHTDATYEKTVSAIRAGARRATHLFNAMPPVHHRRPGPIVALLEDDRVTVEVIGDGTHLHPAIGRQVTRAAGPGRVALVTDAMAAAALGDGRYRLGALGVDVIDGVARVAGTTTIAGSTATMEGLFRRAAGDEASDAGPGPAPAVSDEGLLRAVQQTSANPAASLGRPDLGSLNAGGRADLVVLGPDLRVRDVIRDGSPVHGP